MRNETQNEERVLESSDGDGVNEARLVEEAKAAMINFDRYN